VPTLVVEANKQRIPLDHASITIGSGDKSMIQIQDPKLGPIHCQIVKTSAGFKIISIDQKVGTLINGVRVREQGLKGGDVIQVGDTRFIYHEDGVAARPQTARIAGAPPASAPRSAPGTQRIAGTPSQPAPGTQRIAGVPPRPQTARIAGAPQAPAAQAPRPTTARVPSAPPAGVTRPTQAVRPPTGAVPARPATARVPPGPLPRPTTARVPTQAPAVPKPATGRVAPTKGRLAGKKKEARRGMRGSSRGIKELEKLRIDSHKRRIPPIVFVIGVIALIVVGVVAYQVFVPDPEKQQKEFLKKVAKYTVDARGLESEKKYEEAKAKWRELIGEYNKLPVKLREYFESAYLTWKTEIKSLEEVQGMSSAEEKKVLRFIEDCQLQLNTFQLEEARAFLNRNDWIKKAESPSSDKAKELYAQLEKKVDEAEAAILLWPREVTKFNDLIREKRFPDAKSMVDQFIAKVQDPEQRVQADNARKTVLPSAREHLRSIRSRCRQEKSQNGTDAARRVFDEAVVLSFRGVIDEEELKRTWKEIEEFN
jgi:hypothetical protein